MGRGSSSTPIYCAVHIRSRQLSVLVDLDIGLLEQAGPEARPFVHFGWVVGVLRQEVGDPTVKHVEPLRQFPRRQFASRQETQDLAARRIGKGLEGAVGGHDGRI